MDRYLTELFFLSLIHFSYGFLFVFVYLFCFLSLICTYIPGVCNFLHLVLMAVSFVVIRFLFFFFHFLSFLVSSMKCVICSNDNKKKVVERNTFISQKKVNVARTTTILNY